MKENEVTKAEKVLSLALDLGKSMVKCGAEINRVEETVLRIGYAYNMKDTQIFSVVSMMHATVIDNDGRSHSQTRRIYSYGVNFKRLEQLNDLSRTICSTTPDIDEARKKLEEITSEKNHLSLFVACGYMLSSFAFAIFFGGTLLDGVATLPIAVMIYLMQHYIKATGASKLFFTVLQSILAGSLALLFVKMGFGNNADMIMIGDIMLIIPGFMLINSVREMLCGDLMSGLLRLLESVILAMAIACGFAIPILFARNIL